MGTIGLCHPITNRVVKEFGKHHPIAYQVVFGWRLKRPAFVKPRTDLLLGLQPGYKVVGLAHFFHVLLKNKVQFSTISYCRFFDMSNFLQFQLTML